MDAASWILALASTGVKLSTALYSLGSVISYAEKDMSDIAGDVALTSTLEHSFEIKIRVRFATPSALQDAESIVKRCKDSFADIKVIVDKDVVVEEEGKRRTSKRAKLAWPLKSSRTELLKRRLGSLKSSLMLLLQVLTFAKDQAHGYEHLLQIRKQRYLPCSLPGDLRQNQWPGESKVFRLCISGTGKQ